jgi:hypothetical protein
MKNHIKLPLILLICAVISSCAALRAPDMAKLSIGMDKNSAITALNKKPSGIVGAKKYPGGTVEVLEYITSVAADGHIERAWLYFYKGKLVQYGKPTGNWIIESDNIGLDNGTN